MWNVQYLPAVCLRTKERGAKVNKGLDEMSGDVLETAVCKRRWQGVSQGSSVASDSLHIFPLSHFSVFTTRIIPERHGDSGKAEHKRCMAFCSVQQSQVKELLMLGWQVDNGRVFCELGLCDWIFKGQSSVKDRQMHRVYESSTYVKMGHCNSNSILSWLCRTKIFDWTTYCLFQYREPKSRSLRETMWQETREIFQC